MLFDFESRQFILAHPDLNTTNLFIDPSTYEITCIIDWECASTIPMESFYVVPHLPDTRGPLEDHLRSVFLSAFDHYYAGGNGRRDSNALSLLRNFEVIWAFNKLVQRDAGTYFHYAVQVFLGWKIGDNWVASL